MFALTACGGAAESAPTPDDSVATVERVVDGDTLDATIAGKSTRVRLLNINTPEVARDGQPGECLADEATAKLEDLLPKGTTIHLDYDVERTDRYGRTLARVTRDDDGLNANQALVKAGLATPMTVGANSTYRREMDSAYNVAQAMQVGFFDPKQDCAPPGESASPGTTTSSTASPSATPSPTPSSTPTPTPTLEAPPAVVEERSPWAIRHPNPIPLRNRATTTTPPPRSPRHLSYRPRPGYLLPRSCRRHPTCPRLPRVMAAIPVTPAPGATNREARSGTHAESLMTRQGAPNRSVDRVGVPAFRRAFVTRVHRRAAGCTAARTQGSCVDDVAPGRSQGS
ncbi:thermonuclease family protein [Kocuria marina]|uniref:thermonuclease family protein n=1 Tax=Kocuria marina TaxID=223184 RepID=UPI00272DE139